MTSLFARADRALRRLPDPLLMAIGAGAMLLLAELKISTTWRDVPIADFFLIPVASIAWLASSRVWGYAAAVLAAAMTGVITQLGALSAPLVAALIGASVRLVFYLLVVALNGAVRQLVLAHEEEARVDELTAAANVAQRIRDDLERVELPDGRPVRCSIGVATLVTAPASVGELIHAADQLMYSAKQHGKDRIESTRSPAPAQA